MSDWETVLKLCSNYLETTYGLPKRCLLAMVWAELKNGFPEALMNEDDNARQNIAERAPKAEVEEETGTAEVEGATETNISTLSLFNKTEMTPNYSIAAAKKMRVEKSFDKYVFIDSMNTRRRRFLHGSNEKRQAEREGGELLVLSR